jgi:hypothetical protein
VVLSKFYLLLIFTSSRFWHKVYKEFSVMWWCPVRFYQWRTEGGGFNHSPSPRNSDVLTKLSQIPSSVEYTSITTKPEYGFHSFTNWVKPMTRGLPPPDPQSLCPLSSTEFFEYPPPPKKNSWRKPPWKKFLGTPLSFITTTCLHAVCYDVPSSANMTGFAANRDKRIKALYIYNNIGLI